MLNITEIKEDNTDTNVLSGDPFKFVSKILEMDLCIVNEIFPECGSVGNIFKYYTYDEALKRYNNWYNKKS